MTQAVRLMHRPANFVSPDNAAILRSVTQTERIATFIPYGVFGVVVGVPLLLSLAGLLGRIGLIGFVGLLAPAWLVNKLAKSLIVRPMRSLRYAGAARTLAGQLQSLPDAATVSRTWPLDTPGAVAVTEAGRLVLIDRTTGYEQLWLVKNDIVGAGVEREARQISKAKYGGRFTLGGGSRLFGAFTFGGRSRTTTKTIETAFLEVRYQFVRNGAVNTTVVPFGEDRRGADALCALVVGLDRRA